MRLKLTGKHSSQVEERKRRGGWRGAACSTPGGQRGSRPGAGGVGGGAEFGCRIMKSYMECQTETHRSLGIE